MERKEIMNRLEDADFSNVQANELAKYDGSSERSCILQKKNFGSFIDKT